MILLEIINVDVEVSCELVIRVCAFVNIFKKWEYNGIGVRVGVLAATASRPVRLGIGSPFGTLDQILSCSSFFV
jgi:hypothetical protein